MKKLFGLAETYLKNSTWKDFACFKTCAVSFGIFLGALLPKKYQKVLVIIFGALFIITYIPIVMRLFNIWKKDNTQK